MIKFPAPLVDKLHTFFFAGTVVCWAAWLVSFHYQFFVLQIILGIGQIICGRILRGMWFWQ
jgi:hypothetical protein